MQVGGGVDEEPEAAPHQGLVVGAVSLPAGELIAFATFFTGQQALSAQHLNVALAHPGALRGVLAAGF